MMSISRQDDLVSAKISSCPSSDLPVIDPSDRTMDPLPVWWLLDRCRLTGNARQNDSLLESINTGLSGLISGLTIEERKYIYIYRYIYKSVHLKISLYRPIVYFVYFSKEFLLCQLSFSVYMLLFILLCTLLPKIVQF